MVDWIKHKALYNYLEKTFYRDNHPRYKHLFNEWINNVTESQLDGFYLWKYWEDSGNLKK